MTGRHRLAFPLTLAFRYLRSTRKDAFVSFLSAVAAGGIGLGVAALVLALAALSGLQGALRGEVLERTPELEVELDASAWDEGLEARLEALDEVSNAQTLVKGRGWVRSGRFVQPVDLVGYGGPVPSFFPGASGTAAGLYLSDALVERWGLSAGEVVEIVSPRLTLSPLGPTPRTRSMPVAGVFESGRTEEVERAALPIEAARALVAADPLFVVVETGDLDGALEARRAVESVVGPEATVRTWQDLNRPLFFALRLEKAIMFVAVSLVVVVAALALVADLALVVTSKRAELGILATMGATFSSLQAAFVILGGCIAGLGIVAGAVFGVTAARVLDAYRLVRLPGRIYFLDYLPFRVEAGDVGAVLAVTLALGLASTLWVAQRIGRLRPVEAMRR